MDDFNPLENSGEGLRKTAKYSAIGWTIVYVILFPFFILGNENRHIIAPTYPIVSFFSSAYPFMNLFFSEIQQKYS